MMTSAATELPVPEPGTVIGDKYRVLGTIGAGGMGRLVKAEHLLLRKSVVIKLLHTGKSSATRRRLFREARAAQALSSENVVRVFDLGEHDGAPYIVMELLEGVDLASRVAAEGPLSIEEAVDCIVEACAAVAEAHALGIIHRDLKPANLFWTRTPAHHVVKVLDFGISKVPEGPSEEDCEKTDEHTVLGSPYYMSPEQLRNPATVDVQTDVWSLGVTLYFLLTSRHPFRGPTVREVTAAIFLDAPLDARELRPEIGEELWRVVASAMEKRADRRTPTVAALVQQLVPFASKRGQRAAERAVAMSAPASERRIVGATAANDDVAETTGEVLPTTADRPRRRDAEGPSTPQASATSRRVKSAAGAIIALAIVAAAILGLGAPRGPQQHEPGAAPATAEPAPPPVSTPAPVATVAATIREDARPAPQPTAATVAPAPAPAPPRAHAKPTPAATVSTAASAPPVSSAPRRLDADGVPIVY